MKEADVLAILCPVHLQAPRILSWIIRIHWHLGPSDSAHRRSVSVAEPHLVHAARARWFKGPYVPHDVPSIGGELRRCYAQVCPLADGELPAFLCSRRVE